MRKDKFCVDCKHHEIREKGIMYVSDYCNKLNIYLNGVVGNAKECRYYRHYSHRGDKNEMEL